MRRIFAQAQKELTQLLRDRLAVTLAIVLPVVLLLLQTTAISLTVKDLPIIVQDLDQSQASQKLVDAFRQSLSFHVASWPADRQPEQAFASNKARGALIVPEEFGRQIARGQSATVQMLIDASDENTAQIISGDAAQIVNAYNSENGGSGSPAAGHRRDPAVVQPQPLLAEILRPWNLRAGHVAFPSTAGHAGDVQGRRAKDDSTGLRLEHFGS